MGQQVSVNKSFVPGVAASSALYVSMLSPSATQTKASTAAGPVRGGVCMCVGGERRGKTERVGEVSNCRFALRRAWTVYCRTNICIFYQI